MLPVVKTNIEVAKWTVLFLINAATKFKQILVTSPFKTCSKRTKTWDKSQKKKKKVLHLHYRKPQECILVAAVASGIG